MRMLGRAVKQVEYCRYGCCSNYGWKPSGKKKAKKAQRTRENRMWKKEVWF